MDIAVLRLLFVCDFRICLFLFVLYFYLKLLILCDLLEVFQILHVCCVLH